MFLSYLTLLTALAISACSAYFSVVGLSAIFSGAFWSIIIMGGILEAGKLVTASWLYQNWNTAKFALKAYLFAAVMVLMIITSIGIFGYLSRAHLAQQDASSSSQIKIERIDQQIASETRIIDRAQTALDQLDKSIDAFIQNDRVTRGLTQRNRQAKERTQLSDTIKESQSKVDKLLDEKLPLTKDVKKVEAEMGPLKYVAELIYGDQAKNYFDSAVRFVIILIVTVFDPLAVLLLVAANTNLKSAPKELNVKEPEAKELHVKDFYHNSNGSTLNFGTSFPQDSGHRAMFARTDEHKLYQKSFNGGWVEVGWNKIKDLDTNDYIKYIMSNYNEEQIRNLSDVELSLIKLKLQNV